MRLLTSIMFLTLVIVSLPFSLQDLPIADSPDYTIEGNVVYINDTNAYIAAYPHTINTSQHVFLNVTSKKYEGQVDFAFGFDRNMFKPKSLELYDPYNITTEYSEDLSQYRIDSYTNVYNSTYLEVENQDFLLNASYESRANPWLYNGSVSVHRNSPIVNDSNITIGYEWTEFYECWFDKANVATTIIYWTVTEYVEWKDITQKFGFEKRSFEYKGMNTWYLSNHSVTANRPYHLRFFLTILPKLGKYANVKYFIAFKPQSETLSEAKDNGHLYVLDPWLSGGWGFRIRIDVDSGDVDSNLASFPVLIYLSNSSSGIYDADVSCVFDEVGANRKKIAVTVGEDTETFVEIEKWDSANEQAWLWANITATSASNQTLYLYYDNSHAENTAYVDDTETGNSVNVWDSSFRYVYHMRDQTTATVADSTSNNNDGTKTGANNPPVTPSGMIDDAQDFDGSNDYIWNPSDIPSTYTVEAWVTIDVDVEKFFHGGTIVKYSALIGYEPSSNKFFAVKHSSDGYIFTDVVSLSTFYYITFVADGTYCEIFRDGVSKDDDTSVNTAQTDLALWIGMRADGRQWQGIVDEIRMSTVVRSDAWIKASYESGRDDLLDFGSEETPDPAPINDSCTITDFDDTDNLYAQIADDYTLQHNASDGSGFADIILCHVNMTQGATVRAMFQFNTTSAAFSIEVGSDKWTLNIGACSNVSSGNYVNMTYKFSVQWDAVEESDIDLKAYVQSVNDASDTDTYSDVGDVVTNLVTSNIETTDPDDPDRVGVSSTVQIDFSVRYANNPSSAVASTLYPPDAEFTSISVYDSGDDNMGTDSSITNGAGSLAAMSVSASVGTETYNLYVDMSDADYSDGEESPTEEIITDQIVVYWEQLDDERVGINANIEGRYKAVLDFDDHVVCTTEYADTLSCSWGALSWDAGNQWWQISHTEASVGGVTVGGWSGHEISYDITAITENITETTYAYDRIRYRFEAQPTQPYNGTATFMNLTSVYYEYDNVNVTYTQYQVQRNGSNYLNVQKDQYLGDYNVTVGTIFNYTISSMTETYGISVFAIDGGVCIIEWIELPSGGLFIYAQFSFNISNPDILQAILFNGSASDSSHAITDYDWDYGDNSSGSGLTSLHNYSSYGSYLVVLNVTSAAGDDSFAVWIVIGELPEWIEELNLYPNWDVLILLVVSIFFSILFLGTKKVAWGYISFVAWLILSMLWLFINPVTYFVSFLFLGIAIIILVLTLILQVEALRMVEGKTLEEERMTPV